MHFICDSTNEFISIEKRNRQGLVRATHNWQYPYDRFTFLMNELAKLMEEWLDKYNVNLPNVYRFGFVNLVFEHIHSHHKSDIKLLNSWE